MGVLSGLRAAIKKGCPWAAFFVGAGSAH